MRMLLRTTTVRPSMGASSGVVPRPALHPAVAPFSVLVNMLLTTRGEARQARGPFLRQIPWTPSRDHDAVVLVPPTASRRPSSVACGVLHLESRYGAGGHSVRSPFALTVPAYSPPEDPSRTTSASLPRTTLVSLTRLIMKIFRSLSQRSGRRLQYSTRFITRGVSHANRAHDAHSRICARPAVQLCLPSR